MQKLPDYLTPRSWETPSTEAPPGQGWKAVEVIKRVGQSSIPEADAREDGLLLLEKEHRTAGITNETRLSAAEIVKKGRRHRVGRKLLKWQKSGTLQYSEDGEWVRLLRTPHEVTRASVEHQAMLKALAFGTIFEERVSIFFGRIDSTPTPVHGSPYSDWEKAEVQRRKADDWKKYEIARLLGRSQRSLDKYGPFTQFSGMNQP